MRTIPILLGATMMLGALPATAQTGIKWVPEGMNIKTTEANYDYHFPFNPTVGRFQCIVSKTRMGNGLMISGIRLRPDGTRTSYRPWPLQKVTNFTVGVCNHVGPQYADRYSFKGNRKPGYTEVMKNISLNLPLTPMPATAPEPFGKGPDLKFAKPFLYDGKKGFMIEFFRNESVYQYNRWYIDAHLHLKYVDPPIGTGALPKYYGDRTYIGTGCPTSYWTSMEPTYPGGAIATYGKAFGDKLPVLASIGDSADQFGPGLKLPFDLGALGAPGCTVYCNWLGVMAGVTSGPEGDYRMTWGQVPPDPLYAKLRIFSQGFALDAKFNALGLRVSKARDVTLGVGFPADIDGVSFHINGAGVAAEDKPAAWYPRVIVMEMY